MAVLLDLPRWPAHGTVWGHLVSDTSLVELHRFARRAGIPARSFDLDHYDVPVDRVPELLAAGAVQVPGQELVARLRASGLRVRAAERATQQRRRRRTDLVVRWARLGEGTEPIGRWVPVGSDLLQRWDETHRAYHDTGHLHEVLVHLEVLAEAGEPVPRAVHLAAWFHDAVHAGEPGRDEERSAELATRALAPTGVHDREVAEVARLVRLTASHDPEPGDAAGAALCDADLAVLAATPGRYARYVRAVRAEYRHVPDAEFRRGRAGVLEALLAHPRLFATPTGRARWERPARDNLRRELAELGA